VYITDNMVRFSYQLLIPILGLLLSGAVFAAGQDPGKPSGPDFKSSRERMVETQLRARGISDKKVLAAMGRVERHRFVLEPYRREAYQDQPLPIGAGQTISQPYIVALMTELLELKENEKVLEVGTGSGYQAAVLAEMGVEVYTIEIIPSLAAGAGALLREMGYKNIRFRTGDGYRGWPEAAPFDGIVVTAAPDHVPEPLLAQLKEGGRLVIPVGTGFQQLKKIRKGRGKIETTDVLPVRFVPLTGSGAVK
jgi:protein-L-isoaspartate(D-aspartate) O-methyltransferase